MGLFFDRGLRFFFFFFFGIDSRLWVTGGGGGGVRCVQCNGCSDCGFLNRKKERERINNCCIVNDGDCKIYYFIM